MSEHPYWSYGPEHGVPVVDAMVEGRRTFAVNLAMMMARAGEDVEVTVERARAIERYLKGDA